MLVPDDIAARENPFTELPGTLVANFAPRRIVPGVHEGISCRLHLFMGSDIDRLIGIVVVGAAPRRAAEAGGIGHGGIDGV